MRTRITVTAILAVLVITAAASCAWSAMGSVASFSFREMDTADALGLEESTTPDGLPEAHFVLSVKGVGAISGISMQADGVERAWDTVPGNDKWTLLVKDSEGKTLNEGGGKMPILPFLGFVTVHLYAADDGAALGETRKYKVSVDFLDGSTAHGETTVEGRPDEFTAAEAAPTTQDNGMSAVLYGISDTDAVSQTESFGPDGKADAHFRVNFNTVSAVNGVTIRNIDGTPSRWDTTPGNGYWPVAVIKDGKVKNRTDGSVLFAVEGDTTLDLLAADNGSVAQGDTNYEVLVTFNDGTLLSATAQRESGSTPAPASGEGFTSAVLYAPQATDLAAPSETLQSDGKPDWKTAVTINAQGTILSMIVRSVSGPASEWDTLPGNGKWLAAVSDSSGNILNKPDGAVSIPVSGAKTLNLWLADNGALSDGASKFKVIAVMNDGRIFEREITRSGTQQTPASTPAPQATQPQEPQISGNVRAAYLGKGPKNFLAKGEVASISTPPDANVDAHVRLRLLALQGSIESITVESLDGSGGTWDTVPGNNMWNIIVTKTAQGQPLNMQDGSFSMDITGNTELHLWMADNGKLSGNPGNFRVIVGFADGRRLAQNLF